MLADGESQRHFAATNMCANKQSAVIRCVAERGCDAIAFHCVGCTVDVARRVRSDSRPGAALALRRNNHSSRSHVVLVLVLETRKRVAIPLTNLKSIAQRAALQTFTVRLASCGPGAYRADVADGTRV